MLQTPLTTNERDRDLRAQRTLRRLVALGLPFDCIVSGHWTPVHGPELIDTYLRLLAEHATASARSGG